MYEHEEIAFISCSVLCACVSGFLVLSGFLFPSLVLDRSRPISHIIFCIALCDFLGSIGNALGYHKDGTTLCTTQAFFYSYFFPCSWIWTTTLVFQLKCLIIEKKLWLKYKEMHVICWTLGLFPALLPLSTNTYGQDDIVDNKAPCNIGGPRETKVIWLFFGLFGLPLVCCGIMSLWLWQISSYFAKENIQKEDREYSLFRDTRQYPLALVLTWLPVIVTGFVIEVLPNHHVNIWIGTSALCLSTQYGTLVGLNYIKNSSSFQRGWKGLLKKVCGISCSGKKQGNDNDDDDDDDGGGGSKANSRNYSTDSVDDRSDSRSSSSSNMKEPLRDNLRPCSSSISFIENGSERTISSGERSASSGGSGGLRHPAFVDNGKGNSGYDSDEEALINHHRKTAVLAAALATAARETEEQKGSVESVLQSQL